MSSGIPNQELDLRRSLPEVTGSNLRGSERTPLLDLTAQGVSSEEIARWKAAVNRFSYSGKEALDLLTFPRVERTIQFLRGESEYSLDSLSGKGNLVNNPLKLLRPASLLSVVSMLYENGNRQYPNLYAKTREERGYDDNENENKYIRTIQAFESVATAVLVSLNERDPVKRQTDVKKELDKVFGFVEEKSYSSNDVRKASAVENPQAWLVYSVISILDSPSDGITPLGRLRALELLQLYSASELAEGFRSEKYKNRFHNGYDRMRARRLPYTFCSREERLQPDHKDIWEKNQRIQQLLIRDSNRRIDWRATATALIEKAPEEAVQVALLLLHFYDATEGALAFLRSIPQLGPEAKSRMFGGRATFLIEHKLAAGIDDAVLEGVGLSDAAGSDLGEEIAGKSETELIQMLRRKDRLAGDLEESLVAAEAKGAGLVWENMRLESENKRQQEELRYLRAGRVYGRSEVPKENVVDKLDPKGHYRALGLHPQAFEGLSEDKIQDLILRHYRFFAMEFHPDRGGNNKKMQEINDAYNVIKDPNQRKRYGQ